MSERKGWSDLARLSVALALAALGCVILFGLRVAISGKTYYRFLVWNLLLAIVPYAIAALGFMLLSRHRGARRLSLVSAAIALLWLLFYPNAPYIFTDFIHVINKTYLRASPSEWLGLNDLIWYDLLMNAAFAFIGHFIGLVSMWLVQASLEAAWGKWPARALVGAAILFSGFGIYLGRFSRLNSWDLILDIRKVLGEVAGAASDPTAGIFSTAFALFILLSYVALLAFKRVSPPPTRSP